MNVNVLDMMMGNTPNNVNNFSEFEFNPFNNNHNINNNNKPLFSVDSPKRKREDEEPVQQQNQQPPAKVHHSISSPPMLRPRSLGRPNVLSSAPVIYNTTNKTSVASNGAGAHTIIKQPTTTTTTTTSTINSPSPSSTITTTTTSTETALTPTPTSNTPTPIKTDTNTSVTQNDTNKDSASTSALAPTPKLGVNNTVLSAPPRPNPLLKLGLNPKNAYTPPILTAAAKAAIEKAATETASTAPIIPVFLPPLVVTPEKSEKSKLKSKLAYRKGGGQEWVDPSLADWPENDFRIFVGDLGNEVTDDMLRLAFQRYTSLQKVKVIRDKKTTKSRGFGFVSFGDPHDFIKALREMNGKYIGNRPCKLRKSSWEKRMDESRVAGKKKR